MTLYIKEGHFKKNFFDFKIVHRVRKQYICNKCCTIKQLHISVATFEKVELSLPAKPIGLKAVMKSLVAKSNPQTFKINHP